MQIKGFKEVFARPSYVLLLFVTALLFYMLSVVIADFSDLKVILLSYGFYLSLKLTVLYFIGFPSTITAFSAASMFLITILFGSYISMGIYKTKQIKKMQEKGSVLASIGIFLGIFAPGCAACGLGLASLAGLGGFLVALPLKGLEVSIFAILLLGYANWSVAGKVNQNTCSIKGKRV